MALNAVLLDAPVGRYENSPASVLVKTENSALSDQTWLQLLDFCDFYIYSFSISIF